MKNLSDLIKRVTFKRNRQRLEKSLFEKKENKQLSLFQAIIDDKVKDDESAAKLIYGCSSREKKYQQLKSNLRQKMMILLLQSDLNILFRDKYSIEITLVRRSILISQILLLLNLRSIAVSTLKSTLKSAIQLELTDEIISCCKLLSYRAAVAGDKKDFTAFSSILKDALKLQTHECKAEELKNDLIIKVQNSSAERNDLIDLGKKYYYYLIDVEKELNSTLIRMDRFRVGIRYYNFLRDYVEVLNLCDQFEECLSKKPELKSKNLLLEINANRVEATLYLLDDDNCVKYCRRCLELVNPGTMNWLIIKEYQFLLYIQTLNLNFSLNTLNEVRTHPKFLRYTQIKQEKWKLFEAYLLVLLYDKDMLNNFRIGKLINEIQVYTRDKSGYNLTLLIIEIIYYIKMEKFDTLEGKFDSLKLYIYRYISKKNNYRSYYFIKMLILLPKFNYNSVQVEENSQKYVLKMKEESYKFGDHIESLEIVPYEKLWKIILNIIGRKEHLLSRKEKLTQKSS